MNKEEIEKIHHRINEYKNFWTTMFGEDVWLEISEKAKTKDLAERLSLLHQIADDEIGNKLTEISVFSTVDDVVPKPYSLEKWIYETLNPNYEAGKTVEEYRNTFDKSIKKSLPCCTISATFEGHRDTNHVKKKNGLICIDVDRFTKSKLRKSNICIDMDLCKEMFMQHPSTVYCGYSCSGDGIYAILKIYDADKLDDYFNFFQERFNRIGVNIDESCKDYTRLRFYSVDKEGYFNANAKAYKIPEKKQPKKEYVNKDGLTNAEKVDKILSIIESRNIDITVDYKDWIAIGSGLYDEFGDMGISYFHRFSRFNSGYNMRECEKKFNQCKKLNYKLNAVFGVAKGYDVRY